MLIKYKAKFLTMYLIIFKKIIVAMRSQKTIIEKSLLVKKKSFMKIKKQNTPVIIFKIPIYKMMLSTRILEQYKEFQDVFKK